MSATDPIEREIEPDVVSDVAPVDSGAPDQFDADLAEFTATEAKPAEQFESADQFRAYGRNLKFTDNEIEALLPSDLRDAEAMGLARQGLLEGVRGAREQLDNYAATLDRERDHRDGNALVAKLRSDLPDSAGLLPEEAVKAILLGHYHGDPAVQRDWENRYQNPHAWSQRYDRLAYTLDQSLRKMPDVEQTAVKAAVNWSIRGARSVPRDEAMPDLNKLTDAQFARWQKESFGY